MSTILLVVDDEPDVQLLMKQKFRKQIRNEDFEFIFASNGVEALEKLKKHPEIDVILCDVNMPQMDGITLLSKSREVSKTAQTIIVSAYGDMRNIRKAMNHGAFDFVTKPINFTDLGSTIERTINHVKKLKENIAEKERLYHELERYSRNLEEKVDERTKEIIIQKEIIEAKNQSITESINYAKRIQSAALPLLSDIRDALPESFLFFKPRDIVSGDFYWFSRKDDGKIVLTAADCTGHGVPGAFMSLIGNDLLHAIVNARNITDPSQILDELHQGVVQSLRQEVDLNSREGMDISLCVIDPLNKTLEYSGAKNPLIRIKNGQMDIFPANKQSIGGGFRNAKRIEFQKTTLSLEEPAMYYIFSDGYQDQFGGPNGQKYLVKNFRALLQKIHQLPTSEQHDILEKEFNDWKGKRSQIDDILVMGFRL